LIHLAPKPGANVLVLLESKRHRDGPLRQFLSLTNEASRTLVLGWAAG